MILDRAYRELVLLYSVYPQLVYFIPNWHNEIE